VGIDSDGTLSTAPRANGSPRRPLLRAIKPLTPSPCPCCTSEVARLGQATVKVEVAFDGLECHCPSWLHGAVAVHNRQETLDAPPVPVALAKSPVHSIPSPTICSAQVQVSFSHLPPPSLADSSAIIMSFWYCV
jgi:hypothetical protein